MHERRELEGDARNVATARRFVTESLRRWHKPTGDAVLMTSELATNALVHAGSPFIVDVSCSDKGVVRIEVSDSDPTPPVPKAAVSHESVGGRGLLLVTSLAARWGYHLTRHGKTVWFEV